MEEEQRKKKKRKRQLTLLKEEVISETFSDMTAVLDELRKEGYVDVQICPRCKSAKVRRVGSMSGDMSGHMAITPLKYECLDCGWRERLVIKVTNRPLGWKEMALIAEALDLKKQSKE